MLTFKIFLNVAFAMKTYDFKAQYFLKKFV